MRKCYKFEYENIRVLLIYDEEEKQYIAHALEFDLIGTGKSRKAAQNNLLEMIRTQLEYAVAEEDSGIILHEAPKEYFEQWENARKRHLLDVVADIVKEHRHETSARKQVSALMFPFSEIAVS